MSRWLKPERPTNSRSRMHPHARKSLIDERLEQVNERWGHMMNAANGTEDFDNRMREVVTNLITLAEYLAEQVDDAHFTLRNLPEALKSQQEDKEKEDKS